MRGRTAGIGRERGRVGSETSTNGEEADACLSGTLCRSCRITATVSAKCCKRTMKLKRIRCKLIYRVRAEAQQQALSKERACCDSDYVNCADSAASAGDGGNDQHLVALLEAVLLISEKADVFFVDIEVDEAADLAVFSAQVLAEGGKAAFDLGDELGQVGGRTGNLAHVVGVLLEGVRQQNPNG